MSTDTIKVPQWIIEDILGYGTEEEPRILGSITCECSQVDVETFDLTLPQVGDLFRWAWADASDGFDTSEIVEGADPIGYALDCRDSAADRLRNLLLWAAEHIDPIFTGSTLTLFDTHIEGRDCIVLHFKGTPTRVYATLERVAASKVRKTKAHWVVSRFDHLLNPEPFSHSTTEEEIRELCDFMSRLNGEIRRGSDR